MRQRGSSPKLQVLNTALMSAQSGLSLDEARADREFWGRLVESAVGAHLANAAAAGECDLFYWREGNQEVDFVVRVGRTLTARAAAAVTRSLASRRSRRRSSQLVNYSWAAAGSRSRTFSWRRLLAW